jgi:hypothetical protein
MNLPIQAANTQPAAGMRLRTILRELELSEGEAARILGVKESAFGDWCAGNGRVPRMVWLALAALKIRKTLGE